jgi:Terminase DNA packaging enzyme
MSDVDNKLSDILNTDYVPVVTEEHKSVTIHEPDRSAANPDADYSRANYYNLIEKGNEALDGILEVARESQHPRAYEVAANMIKNLSDVTEKLMVLQKQQKDLIPKEQQVQTQNINVDKAVFVGSTAELLKQLKNESGK